MEKVSKFDLMDAFKALDELDAPKVGKVKPNKDNYKGIKESFSLTLKTDCLLEDYYNVNDSEDLETAKADRAEEVAQAKLAKIEKIVDLDAETPEDVQPSYVGKTIVQCPQCMTLFYRNPEDINISEEDASLVNVGEACPNCGHDAGYTVIGKVAAEEQPAEQEAPAEENELDLNLEEPAEENQEASENKEAPAEGEEEVNLEPVEEEPKEEEKPEEEEEEKKEESFEPHSENILAEQVENALKEEIKEEACPKCGKNPCECKKEECEECKEALEDGNIKQSADLKEDIEAVKNDSTIWKNLDAVIKKASTRLAWFLDDGETSKYTDSVKLPALPIVKKMGFIEDIPEDEDPVENYNFIHFLEQVAIIIERRLISEFEQECDGYFECHVEWNKAKSTNNEFVFDIEYDFSGKPQGYRESLEEDLVDITDKVIKLKKCDRFDTSLKARLAKIDHVNRKFYTTPDQVKYFNIALNHCIDKEMSIKEDLNSDMKKYNDYVNYLQVMLKQDEEALEKAKKMKDNEFAIKVIEKRIAADKEDLEAAIPNIVKEKQNEEELPTPEETGEEMSKNEEHPEEAKNESLKESVQSELAKFVASLDENCEKCEESIENEEKVAEFEQEIEEQPLHEEGETCDAKLMKEINEPLSFKDMINGPVFKRFSEEVEKPLEEELPAEVINAANECEDALDKLNAEDQAYVDSLEKAQIEISDEEEIEEEPIEELNDSFINNTIGNYLTEVYSNVDNFTATECSMLDNKLIIEGNINFKSGKTKATKFEFTETAKNIYEGYNKDLADDGKFTLTCFREGNGRILMAESLAYNYKIGKNLVEGFAKAE